MEGLGIDPLQLGAQIINFVIILYILKRFLYTPILTMLDKRKKEIDDGLALKQEMEERKEKLQHKYKKKQAELREEERRVMKQAVSEAKKRQNEIIEEAKKEIASEREKMLQDDEKQKENAMQEAREKALEYAMVISKKLLKKHLDKKDQERMLQEAREALEKN